MVDDVTTSIQDVMEPTDRGSIQLPGVGGGVATISVMIVEDKALYRSGLVRLLEEDSRLEVRATSAGDRGVPDLCRSLQIDVVVCDAHLTTVDAIELIRNVRSRSPGTRVLVVASVSDWRVLPAMDAGADGFLLKDMDPENLRAAVVAVHGGDQVLCRQATQWLINTPAMRLTPRETDVIRLIIDGATNREISALLHIGEKTVRNYVSHLYQKLLVRNRAELVELAQQSLSADIPPFGSREQEALP